MGGISAGQIVNTVVGVGGTVASSLAAKSQAEDLNRLMGRGEQQAAQVAGLDEYFLGGGRAEKLNVPGFREQFSEVDFSQQEQLRAIDQQAAKSRQMIADNIPPGGAKLRALADLAVKTQDAHSQVVREAESKKRDLDIKLTNQYLQNAMNRQVGPSQEARLWAAQQDYQNRQRDMGAIAGALGSLGEQALSGEQTRPAIEYREAEVPGAGQGVEAASTWSPQEDYLTGPLGPEYTIPEEEKKKKLPPISFV